MAGQHPCPCCGYLVFAGPPGSAEICPVCYWEDDHLQLCYATTLAGWSNAPTLEQAQVHFVRDGACSPDLAGCVTPSDHGFARDPAWRMIDPEHDTFPVWDAPGRDAPLDPDALYYWLRDGRLTAPRHPSPG
jgi:hypothetical protein